MDNHGLPRTAQEFEAQFGTEEACIAYVRKLRWPEGFRCPKCGGGKSWTVRTRALDECTACGHQVSITAGTVFENTRKPLTLWFRIISQFVVSKSGCSAKDIQRQQGVSYQTAWTWLHKLRCGMDRLGGKALAGTVEVDESYLGGTDDKAHKGRSLAGKKALVVAAIEIRGPAMGRLRLEPAANAGATSLCGFVERNVDRTSTVKTDGLAAYNGLPGKGYDHRPAVIGDPKNAAQKLPRVHRIFSLLRRLFLGTYQGANSHKHLKAYLDEFTFRFNRRASTNRWLLLHRLLTSCLASPPTYAAIIGREDPSIAST